MLVHHKIKELREKKKLSQEHVASRLGICQNTYHLIEIGKSKLKLEHAIQIADIFDVSINELMSDEERNQNIFNNTIENGGQQIIQNIVHEFSMERKDLLEFLKNLVNNQLNTKDDQILIQSKQIDKLIKVLEK